MSSERPLHFQEPVWGRLAESGVFSVSPDGQHVVLATEGPDGVLRFWARTMSSALAPVPLAGDDAVMAVEVEKKGSSSPAPPQKLFNVPGVMPEWGVTKDGGRFLFAVPVGPTPPLTVVRDCQAGLSK